MILEQLGIAFIGAIFGGVVGFSTSIFWERKKEQKELKKLKQLLQDDFKRLYDIMYEGITLVEPHLESEKKMESFVDELILKKLDVKMAVGFNIPLEFNFWKVIEDSGLLIKLSLDEIKHVKNTYQFINENTDLLEHSYGKWLDVLGSKIPCLDKLNDNDKKEIIHATNRYFFDIIEYCQNMMDILYQESEKFDWIKNHMK